MRLTVSRLFAAVLVVAVVLTGAAAAVHVLARPAAGLLTNH